MAIKKYNVGIDLGTTNSVFCVYNETYSRPDVLKIYGKNGIIPSVIYYDDKDKKYIIGEEAKEQADFYANSFSFMKIEMTRGDEEVAEYNGLKMTPIDFSAKLLKYMYDGFKEHYGNDAEIENLVITVPAYFKDKERKCTIEAVNRAGIKPLNELRLINEPTAATLAYGDELTDSNIVVTYDLGGGTFDVTLLEIDNVDGIKIFQAKETAGKTLGGYDFDRLIIHKLISCLGKENFDKISKEERKLISNSLKSEAEKIKISLSKLDSVHGTCIAHGLSEKYLIDYNIEREEFEKMIDSMLDETIEMTKKIIGDFKVNDFVLVGGSTRIPLVEEKIRDEFGQINIVKVDPDLIVASGAAIQAGIIGKKRDSVLNEILSGGNIGVSVRGDFVSFLVREGTPIPFSISERFVTATQGTSTVETYVVQGKEVNLESKNNLVLGKIVLDNLVVSQHSSVIEIKINVNKSGEVEIIANEVARGGSTAVKLFKIDSGEKQQIKYIDFSGVNEIFKNLDDALIIDKGNKMLNSLETDTSETINIEVKNWFLDELDNAIMTKNINKIKELLYRISIVVE